MAVGVLIVDDSRTARSVIEKALRLSGTPLHEVLHASNGEEALSVLADHWVDIVFSDINMPVMDGVTFLDKLREDSLLKGLPVVVISSDHTERRAQQLAERQVAGFLRKPFQPEQIRDVIRETLGLKNE